MNSIKYRTKYGLMAVSILLAFYLLYLLSKYNYLIFHSMVELLSAATALAIFTISLNSRKFTRNDFFSLLGIGFLFSGILEALHLLSYKGLNIFPDPTANIATQFWVGFRFLQASTFFIAINAITRRLSRKNYAIIFSFFLLAAVAIIFTILGDKTFPTMYGASGLTEVKKISEYAISLIFLASIVNLYAHRKSFDIKVYRYLFLALLSSIFAELSFTHYVSVYGFFNMLGHYFLLIGIFFTYRAMVEKTLSEPFTLLFKELNEANRKLASLAYIDELTGLYNRRHIFEKIKEQFEIAQRLGKHFTILMLDIDNLKIINDLIGHHAGDEVIKTFGRLLAESFRKIDLLGRYGGDEFIVCPIESDAEKTEIAAKNFLEKLKIAGVSASFGLCDNAHEKDLTRIIHSADQALLSNKKAKKVLELA